MIGYAVYDLRDGSVVKQVRETDFGLAPGFTEHPLSWLGEGRVKFGYVVAEGSNTAAFGGAFVWNVDEGTTRRLAHAQFEDALYVPTYDPERFVRLTDDANLTLSVTDDHGRPTGATIRVKGWEGGGPSWISESPRFVVLVGPYGKGNPQRVSAAPRRETRSLTTELTSIGRLVAPTFVGWRTESSVLVIARKGMMHDGFLGLPEQGTPDDQSRLYGVDLGTGKTYQLGRVDDSISASVQVARLLLVEPLVHGRKPPSVLAALRVPLGIGGLVLVGALGGIAFIRRRRRA
jgi:hypothetical protein